LFKFMEWIWKFQTDWAEGEEMISKPISNLYDIHWLKRAVWSTVDWWLVRRHFVVFFRRNWKHSKMAGDDGGLQTGTIPESPHVKSFLSGLPSFKQENFTKFSSDGIGSSISNSRRPALYVCTKECPSEQLITTEKTNILLRYLHTQWDRKSLLKKREGSRPEDEAGPSSAKMPKMTSTSNL